MRKFDFDRLKFSPSVELYCSEVSFLSAQNNAHAIWEDHTLTVPY
jgi:hypothetical protein